MSPIETELDITAAKISLGHAIRRHRLSRGISQDTLAVMSGMDRTYIGGIERGERNPTVANLAKLAHALSVPISELFSG